MNTNEHRSINTKMADDVILISMNLEFESV